MEKVNYILLEDEFYTSQYLTALIGELRPEFHLAGRGESSVQARQLLSQNPDVDLVITDLNLSDGICLNFIEGVSRHTPVIIFTGNPQYKKEWKDKPNIVDFVLKPITRADIIGSIEKFERNGTATTNLN